MGGAILRSEVLDWVGRKQWVAQQCGPVSWVQNGITASSPGHHILFTRDILYPQTMSQNSTPSLSSYCHNSKKSGKKKSICQSKFGTFLLGSACSRQRTTNIRPLFMYHNWANCSVSMTHQAPILRDEPSPWVAPAEMYTEYHFGSRNHLYFLSSDVKTCFLISFSQINCWRLEDSEAEGLVSPVVKVLPLQAWSPEPTQKFQGGPCL